MNAPPNAFFVYGTLKRGEERAPLWPRPAIRVEPATARGRLRDLGPYPAMVEGTDCILGELWVVARDDLEVTLWTLDAIECFDQGGVDLYVRRIIPCRTLQGEVHQANAYFYGATEAIADKPLVAPDGDGYCAWTANPRRVNRP